MRWTRFYTQAGQDGSFGTHPLHAPWLDAAERGFGKGLFRAKEDAQVFHDELRYMILRGIVVPEPGLPALALPAETAGVRQRLEALALEAREGRLEVSLPVENDERLDFINWKKEGDLRETAEGLGRRIIEAAARRVMDACDRDSPQQGFDPAHNAALAEALDETRRIGVPEAALRMAIHYAEQGYEDVSFTLPEEERGRDTLLTALSVPDSFVEAALTGHEKIWDSLAEAIWISGEPAVIFRDKDKAKGTSEGATVIAPATDKNEARHALRVAATLFRALGQPARLTLVVGYDTTVDAARGLLQYAWETGVARIRLYREGGTLLHAVAAPLEKTAPFSVSFKKKSL